MSQALPDETNSDGRLGVVLLNHTDKVRPEVDMLTRALPTDRFDVTVVLPESARETLTRYDGIDYRFYRAWIVPNVRYTVPHPSFRALLDAELRDASVLHVLGYIYLPCLVAAATAADRGVRTVLTVDAFPGIDWTYGNAGVDAVAALYTHTLGRVTLSLVDRAIGIGEYLRDDLERFTGADVEVAITPNGVDTDRYRPAGPQGPDTDGPVGATRGESVTELLYVGRLDTVKGIPTLLRAVAQLGDGYHLTIVGDGSRRADYEALADDLGLSATVTFAGYQSNVARYYRSSDIFVLPSLSEGLPTVLMEAQACGLPVVSTDVGGARELVRGGRLVPTGDPAALSTAIAAVADSDLDRRGAVAREHVTARYTLERMAESYAATYRELAAAVET